MKIFLGADHQGFELKEAIFAYLAKRGIEVEDIGAKTYEIGDDFPEFAAAAALRVIGSQDSDPRAILICGGGQGMAIAANRFRGIRAVVVDSPDEARMSRHDNNANILSLPARLVSQGDVWQEIVRTWLETNFSGEERYARRNQQLDNLA